MSRQAIYVRLGALAIALAIAFAVVWSYGMTATIIGTYLSHRGSGAPQPGSAAGNAPINSKVVTVSVLPANAAPAAPHRKGSH
ncbi:MAG: hypothetical protein KGO02_13420 [Alphaproteobacteria bacterium]|nr:hypothetical protein [Alphaproteobacteria bacterium]